MFTSGGLGGSKVIVILTLNGFQGAANSHLVCIRHAVGLPGQAAYAIPGVASAIITQFDNRACLQL